MDCVCSLCGLNSADKLRRVVSRKELRLWSQADLNVNPVLHFFLKILESFIFAPYKKKGAIERNIMFYVKKALLKSLFGLEVRRTVKAQ